MRMKFGALLAFALVVTTGCAMAPQGGGGLAGGSSAAACAAPQYGFITDENFQVIEVIQGSPAEAAGMLPSDQLLDAAWVRLDPIVCNDTVALDASGSPLSPIGIVPIRAPVEPPAHLASSIPFTDSANIQELMGYTPIMKFRVQRGDQVVEVTIAPGHFSWNPGSPDLVTSTPAPPGLRFY